jgi:hypothetical protein
MFRQPPATAAFAKLFFICFCLFSATAAFAKLLCLCFCLLFSLAVSLTGNGGKKMNEDRQRCKNFTTVIYNRKKIYFTSPNLIMLRYTVQHQN